MIIAATPEKCAEILNISVSVFRRKWRRMVAEHGFPAPLPGLGLRWSLPQIIRWIEANGVNITPAPEPELSCVDFARKDLEARYAAR